jgi:hypothetical protein
MQGSSYHAVCQDGRDIGLVIVGEELKSPKKNFVERGEINDVRGKQMKDGEYLLTGEQK